MKTLLERINPTANTWSRGENVLTQTAHTPLKEGQSAVQLTEKKLQLAAGLFFISPLSEVHLYRHSSFFTTLLQL